MRNYKFDSVKFVAELDKINWTPLFNFLDADQAWNFFVDKFVVHEQLLV